ncbi:MAG: sigma 54-interacting transcriptional regulator [Terrimicrobiaceae bacterium]|nr:sigma 54-interacting transcriptional regulator [Terrimicrobiaceae bacterium]
MSDQRQAGGPCGDECPPDCDLRDPANDVQPDSDRMCRVVEKLRVLFNVSQTLQQSPDLREIVKPVLKQMAESLGLYRGTVRILNRETGDLLIDEAFGLSAEEMAAERIRLGEGVIGQVVQSGRPIVVPDIEASGNQSLHIACNGYDGQSLQRPGATAFLCVPIAHGTEIMGTLSGYRRSGEPSALEADLRLLTVTAQLIAQAARLRQTTHENMEALRRENERLQEQIRKHFKPDNIIGNSRAMQIVYHSIEQVAGSVTTVLIRGESGVGKELVAHAIHARSPRAHKPLVKVNCAALPESIVESELFGHERGAFTGAISMRKGRFELAHGGTIFLDEIGELPLSVQAKLLRILQEREFERVGGAATLRCDVRVIAATNRALEDYMQAEKFRLDLYYRLNVFPIYVPPLRERKSDILALADFFVEKYSEANSKPVMRISTPAIDMLMSYHWPGNVRELENCMERAVLLSTDGVIHGYHLPPTLQTAEATATEPKSKLAAALGAFEREMILEELKLTRGNIAQAARQLGLTERILGLRVRKFRINPRKFREG